MADTVSVVLDPLPAAGLDTLATTLRAARLPHEDLAGVTKSFFCASANGITVGYVGLEISDADALLRSAVIFSRARGHGYGRAMIERLLEVASDQGIRRVWLLTTSAPGFFAKLRFHATPRTQIPASLAQSEEFRCLCPDTAVCMVCDLSDPPSPGAA